MNALIPTTRDDALARVDLRYDITEHLAERTDRRWLVGLLAFNAYLAETARQRGPRLLSPEFLTVVIREPNYRLLLVVTLDCAELTDRYRREHPHD